MAHAPCEICTDTNRPVHLWYTDDSDNTARAHVDCAQGQGWTERQ